MIRFVIRRVLVAIPILLLLSVLVFVAARSTSSPEAAIRSNPRVSQEDIQRYREALGLDDSNSVQYVKWLGNFVQGDLGDSLVKNRPVWPLLRDAIGNTLILGLAGVIVALLLGIVIGTVSALRQYSWFDHGATGLAFFGLSMPQFWFALTLQLLVGVWMVDWFNLDRPFFALSGMRSPGSSGFDLVDRIRHLTLPATVLAVQLVAVYSRYMRASMLEVMHSDYLRTARAKGLPESRVVIRHGVRTALIPVTTQAAIDLGLVVGGLIITEQIFQWPGMGRLFLDAMGSGDYQIVLPWLMITASAVILLNLVADLLYAFLDPRIRYD